MDDELPIVPYEPMVTPESVEPILIPDFQDVEYLTSLTETGIEGEKEEEEEEKEDEEEEEGEEEEVKA